MKPLDSRLLDAPEISEEPDPEILPMCASCANEVMEGYEYCASCIREIEKEKHNGIEWATIVTSAPAFDADYETTEPIEFLMQTFHALIIEHTSGSFYRRARLYNSEYKFYNEIYAHCSSFSFETNMNN